MMIGTGSMAATVARRRPRRQMTIGSVDGTSDGSVVD